MRWLYDWVDDTLASMRRWGGRRWAYAASAALLVVCVLGSLLAVWHSFATPAPHAAQAAPPRVKLSGIVPPARAKAQRTGRERGSTELRLSIGLRLANQHALQQLLASQQDPHSANYHHYLTPQAFTDAYGPPAAAVTSVTSFLRAAGLHVTSVSPNRTLIDASGTVSQIEQAFGVTLGQYTLGGHTYYAPDSEPTLPTAIAPYVLNVGGLDNFFHMAPHNVIQHAHAAPAAANTPPYAPADLQGAYDVTPLLSSIDSGTPTPGSKGDVAVFELAPYIPTDVTSYESNFSLPISNSSTLRTHPVDGATVTCATAGSSCDVKGVAEADLDVEVVSALAPYATQDVYTGPNSTAGVNDTYSQIVTDNTARAITTSWGLCEPYTGQAELVTLDNIFLQAQSQGQTVFAAAGDSGTDDCQFGVGATPTVDSPASDPHVVAVGGTTLTLNSGAYGSETVWNSTNPPGSGSASSTAGGGGLSSYFSPATDLATGTVFQYGAGVTNTYAAGQRQVPDVAADADPNTGYYLYCTSTADCSGGSWWSAGGTSASTPLWAATYNDMDVYYGTAASPTGQHIGWGYKVLYQLFANAQTATPYHDVTTGNNDIDDPSGSPYYGFYPAAACYDLASGMGSPDAWAMAQDIAAGVKTAGGGPCGALPVHSLIADGGFENGSTDWHTFSLRGDQVITINGPHLGTSAFTPCQSVGCDDRVWQTVTVPATVHSASLTFWVNGLTTASGGGALCADHLYVLLAAADGTVFDTANAASTCAYSTGGQYVVKSYDVTSALQAHQGQAVIVMLRATNTNLSPAPRAGIYWHVDDVALDVS